MLNLNLTLPTSSNLTFNAKYCAYERFLQIENIYLYFGISYI